MSNSYTKSTLKEMANKKLGILGGGQLGKMIGMAATKLGIKVNILDPEKDAPAFQIANKSFVSSYIDKKKIEKFARHCDAVTYEFESIPLECLRHISNFTKLYPGITPLRISQNRLLEKQFINSQKIKVADFSEVKSKKDIKNFLIRSSNVGILKTTTQGYDGKGQKKINLKNLKNINIDFKKNNYIFEKMINFKKEISVIVVRKKNGDLICYRPAENKHEGGILRETNYPALVSDKIENQAKKIAKRIANSLNLIGIIAVEMFVTLDDNIVVNEIAPRPHNSGHWTMDVCNISQFEALVRTIFDLPIKSLEYYHKCKMINILGENYNQYFYSFPKKNHRIYIYGKNKIKAKRKMGHVNVIY